MVDKYSKPEYDTIVEKDVMIEMRDGIRLATDIYHPARGSQPTSGEFPCLQYRTPYGKNNSKTAQLHGHWFAKRGYCVAIQDCRGLFNSEGIYAQVREGLYVRYANEAEDGYDTIEWIAKQPWSNGKIGTMGTSYMAHTQLTSACLNPPHLSAMIINEGGFSNSYRSGIRNGGAFMNFIINWSFNSAINTNQAIKNPVIAEALRAVDPNDYFDPKRWPLKKGETPLRFLPNYEEYLFDLMTKTDYSDYWKRTGLNAEEYYNQMADVPTLIMGGWYDLYTQGSLENYQALSTKKKGPICLIMGPWTHGAHQTLGLSYTGDVDFGVEANLDGNLAKDYNHLRLRWFDQWLKGKDMGLEDESPAKIFVMGGGPGLRGGPSGKLHHGGRWRDEEEWPLKRTHNTPFYLKSGGMLTKEAPIEGDASTQYLYDPMNPVPTVGGNSGNPSGALDQIETKAYVGCNPPYLPLSTRNDVIVFKTPQLKERIEITGNITVELWASSSSLDTDFTAKLIDIHPQNADYPNGFAMILSDGIIRARYRSSWSKPELMEPRKIYKFKINLNPTSNLFEIGHQIRLDISSSNFPKYDINPNTGEPIGLNRRFETAINTIYYDKDNPSMIKLPITPQ